MMRPRPPASFTFCLRRVPVGFLFEAVAPSPHEVPMKTIRRFALVLALTLGAAACSTNITGPDWETAEHTPGSGNHTPGSGNHTPGSGN